MKLGFPFIIVSSTMSATGLALYKFHSLTTFHVYISLFFGIVFMLMYIERIVRQSIKPRKMFVSRANVLSLGVVWFYITNSIAASQVHFKEENTIVTNLLSCSFVLVALGASLYRKKFRKGIQEKLMLLYVILLCFPMNLLQNTEETMVVLRFFLFFLIFNLELYVGKTLRYRTTFKQLVMCSYFVFVVNPWYLVASIPVVLTHFLEIQKRTKRPHKQSLELESATDSSYESCSSEEVTKSRPRPRPRFDIFSSKPEPESKQKSNSKDSEEIRRLLSQSKTLL